MSLTVRPAGASLALAAAILTAMTVPADAVSRLGPLDPVEETIAENQAQGPYNVYFAGNIGCQVTPYDALGTYPAFYGSGAGTPQATVENVLVKAADDVAFAAVCASPSSQAFEAEVDYTFQYRTPSGWSDIPNALSCSESSISAGDVNAAVVAAPGSAGCAFERIYPEDHYSIGAWHRLKMHLTVSLAGGGTGPDILGWTLPWFVGTT